MREITVRRPAAVLIAGPTASGKSALASRIAAASGGAVVNADSMQVYRDLRIITARPSVADEMVAPHRLYGHVDGADAYSVGRWLADVEVEMSALLQAGQLPIITGGTGLYFKSLLGGLSPMPPVPDEIRAHWRRQAGRLEATELYQLLVVRDPEGAALLRPSDPQRVTRALEVLEATGRPLRLWQAMPGRPLLEAGNCVCLVLSPARDRVHATVSSRFDDMLAAGALAEVEALVARGLPAELPVMRATGVPELAAYLRGEATCAAAVEAAKLERASEPA